MGYTEGCTCLSCNWSRIGHCCLCTDCYINDRNEGRYINRVDNDDNHALILLHDRRLCNMHLLTETNAKYNV